MQEHLRLKHNQSATMNNYHDFSQDHLEEMIEKFHQCFGLDQEEAAVDSNRSQDVCKIKIKNRIGKLLTTATATKAANNDSSKTKGDELMRGNTTGFNQMALVKLRSGEIDP